MADPARTKPGRWQPRPRPLLRTMVGDVLRRTRQAQGRTLADVARAARVSVPYLSELERGRKEASSEVLAAICDALWQAEGSRADIERHVLSPLRAARERRLQAEQARTAATKVDFFTLVRGEDER